jgi:hypothetical protein
MHFRPGSLLAFVALSTGTVLLLAASAPSAHATRILDFTFPNLSNGSDIPDKYGDVKGALDMDFRCEDGSNASYWSTDYSDLLGVAYGCSSYSTQITFKPQPGFTVTLLGFDFGAYSSDRSSKVKISDSATTFLDEDPIEVLLSQRTTYNLESLGIATDSNLTISFGPDSYNVGIDNIRFELTGVPAPLPLFGALGAFQWSRRLRSRSRHAAPICPSDCGKGFI